ncbi:unnamed protein product [Meganyctiphanes norvegica]|uniref:Platelet-derived growth factor (PDGF) family profile domain-containing protein n=1 Tax=Meganyctiphanes norvegica TaxID=48144 RepID=A0AAV2RAJ5_MEGNR
MMLSVCSTLLLGLCVCVVLGSRSRKGGGFPELSQHSDLLWRDLEASLGDGIRRASGRIQRGLPGSSYRISNSLNGFGKTRFDKNEKDIFWPGKNEAAIELEEEPDDWEDYKTGSDEYDYMDAAPFKKGNAGDRMRPHEMALMKLASENARRVMEEGKCAFPVRKCVPVADDPEKKYWPTCALVHRCDDSTGCCTSEQHSCQPKDSDHLDLYFYVFVNTEDNGNRGGVQRLTFRNDTSCECKTKPKVQQPICQSSTPSCRCPKHFESVIRSGHCVCDCIPNSASYKACRRYKRGKKFFSQTCLSDGKCTEPQCEYGSYLPPNKRCMRKSEREGKKKMRIKHK